MKKVAKMPWSAKLNPKSVTVFLDTCYSGETRSDEMLIASAKPIFSWISLWCNFPFIFKEFFNILEEGFWGELLCMFP